MSRGRNDRAVYYAVLDGHVAVIVPYVTDDTAGKAYTLDIHVYGYVFNDKATGSISNKTCSAIGELGILVGAKGLSLTAYGKISDLRSIGAAKESGIALGLNVNTGDLMALTVEDALEGLSLGTDSGDGNAGEIKVCTESVLAFPLGIVRHKCLKIVNVVNYGISVGCGGYDHCGNAHNSHYRTNEQCNRSFHNFSFRDVIGLPMLVAFAK